MRYQCSLRVASAALVLTTSLPCTTAQAQEAWAGVTAHGADTPFTYDLEEGGADLQVGVRSAPLPALAAIGAPSGYSLASVSLAGDTSLLAAGLSWRLGAGPIYLRPGIGLAVHDGPRRRVGKDGKRTDLGSRVLFEPELAIGWQATRRLAIEASWVHVSHAQLFGGQNPGLDLIGLRAVVPLR